MGWLGDAWNKAKDDAELARWGLPPPADTYWTRLEARGVHNAYAVQLLLTGGAPARAEVLEALREKHAVAGDGTDPGLWGVTFTGHVLKASDGSFPYAVQVVQPPAMPFGPELATSLEQTWGWPEARAAVARAQTSVVVQDMGGGFLAPAVRLELVSDVVEAVTGALPADALTAIHWLPAQRVIDPARLVVDTALFGRLAGAVNVRLFRVGGSDEVVMDTMGLAVLGRRDLECRFAGLPQNEVAALLRQLSLKFFADGEPADGDTLKLVDGAPLAGRRFAFAHGTALCPPHRQVLSLTHRAG
jgi:hypothetical protein